MFGKLREVAGWRERHYDPTPPTLDALKALIVVGRLDLAAALGAPGVQAAVDRVLVRGDCPLAIESEVAFMPAMSGG